MTADNTSGSAVKERIEQLHTRNTQAKKSASENWAHMAERLQAVSGASFLQSEQSSATDRSLRDLINGHFQTKTPSERAAYPVSAVDAVDAPNPGLPSHGKSPFIG